MPAQVVDLFCGVGGLTCGLTRAGLEVVAGIDVDPTCSYAYEHNNHVPYLRRNIREISGEEIEGLYNAHSMRILVGCAPCQPFSQMRSKLGKSNLLDEKYDLLLEFGRLINEIHPTIISMENVPNIRDTNVYNEFVSLLEQNGYHYDAKVVYCPEYGIPQTRRRFVLVGSLLGEIELIPPTHNPNQVHVRDYIARLPEIEAGQVDPQDPLHRASALSELNLRRIRASRPGGTWHDWPEELRCECHKKDSGESYPSVYGRMTWEQIGPTITTQFYNYGTGRYGHPEQDRALSLREGALLQTFPLDYEFVDPGKGCVIRDVARHIGNAVPVRLGEVIGMSIREHLDNNGIYLEEGH